MKISWALQNPILDYLKIKASWGQLGSDAINARFLYLSRYSTVANNYAFGGTTYPGLNPTASNPTVSWETSTKSDVGFEARLFKGKLDVEFDYFYEKRADILAVRSSQIPSTYGGPLPAENVGEVENKGLEITLGHTNRINNDLTYNIKANLTLARIK
jgi:outer membrane receptor protein involved in Fe transport